MIISSNLGFPRIGPRRELKKALEAFWAGKADEATLQQTGQALRRQAWLWQKEAGIAHIPSNDFSLYDHVLDTAAMVGAVPSRFGENSGLVPLATYCAMARGVLPSASGNGQQMPASAVPALEMTKWFDSNYHYLVPEWSPQQRFQLSSTKPIDEFLEASALGIHTRPVLLGPVTLLLLGKSHRPGFDRLSLLESLLPVYEEVLSRLAQAGADWIQIDEPCLATDLDAAACSALERTYQRLGSVASSLSLLVATYFGPLGESLATALRLPVQALHVDLVRGREQLDATLHALPEGMALSLGVVDGRNIWKTDLAKALAPVQQRSWPLAPTECRRPVLLLLHVPVDWPWKPAGTPLRLAAFARQKWPKLPRGQGGRERSLASRQIAEIPHPETARSPP